jgi:hypothetical protein
MQRTIRFEVEVPASHVIRLPDDVPVGPVEIIVLLADSATGQDRASLARRLLETCPAQSSDSANLVAEDRLR